MTKRLITLAMCLAMTAALFTGCGGSASDEVTDAPATQDPAAEATAAPAEVPEVEESDYIYAEYPLSENEISFSLWTLIAPPAYMATDDLAGLNYAIEAAAAETNVTIDWQLNSPLTMMDNFNIMVSSGDYPDFVYGFSGLYSSGVTSAIQEDVIVPLNDYIAYMPNYAAALEKYGASLRDTMDDEGEIYGIGMLNDETESTWLGLGIRQDWLDELGLDVPVTIADYEEVLTAFKVSYDTCASGPLWIAPQGGNTSDKSWSSAFDTIIGAASDDNYGFIVKDGVVEYGPANEGYKEYITLMADWYDKGLIYNDFVTADDIQNVYVDDSGVLTGKYGVMDLLSSNIETYIQESDDDNFAITPLATPIQYEGQEIHLGQIHKGLVDGVMSITTACGDVQLACQFWDWFFTESAVELENYGIEGESYNKTADGFEYTDLITSKESYNGCADYVYLIRGQYPGVYLLSQRSLYGYADIAVEARRIWTESGGSDYLLPYGGITFTADEGSEIGRLIGDLSTYAVEMTIRFIVGEEPIENLDAFQAQLSELGADKVCQIYQQGYDRYMAR